MKIKTSITLDESLVKEMDKLVDQYGNRSALIEQAVRTFLNSSAKQARDARDIAIMNRLADKLNAEAEDALQYQVEL